MISPFTSKDIAALNSFLKTVNDRRLAHQNISVTDLRPAMDTLFADHTISWLAGITDIINDAETKLFSYGTLQPGQQNEHMLKHLSGSWAKGFVYGELENSGWGASYGFPVLTLDYSGQKPKVQGQLFTSTALPGYWKVLDEFEGEDYIRLLTIVYVSLPESITIASVYASGQGRSK